MTNNEMVTARAKSWIPPALRSGLQKLAALSSEHHEALRQEFLNAPTFSPPEELEEAIQRATGFGAVAAEELLRGLFVFATVQNDQPDLAFAAEEAVRAADLEIADDQRAAIADLAGELFRTPTIQSSAKAYDLLYDQEHLFVNARVVTELRPIFGDDAAANPEAMTIFSTLSLKHFTNGETHQIHLTLDQAELENLQQAIERALAKIQTLNKYVRQSGLPLYRVEKENE